MSFGTDDRAYVIAEAGVNHNGSLDLARQLVLAAKEAGADAVKFQTFKADRVAQAGAPKADYQLRNTDGAESQIEMLRKLELPAKMHVELIALCREVGIEFLSTPYNEEDIDFLHSLGVRAFKLASIHCVEPHMLRHAARTGRHLIVSTGMADFAEVQQAVQAMRGVGHEDFTLLQCTTNYPSRVEDANVRVIPTLRARLGCAVGYSDHTQSDVSCIAAIALGATMIEKHFTLDRTLPGPDHTSAAEPAEFAALVRKIRETEAALGSGAKKPCEAEIANTVNMRRSLVARRAIAKGETVSEALLTCRRPATGLSPLLIGEITGRTAVADIPAGAQIARTMLD
jgi:N-acetylneuraminate synthase/N,N'-diacetyllegionaminate synthase